MSSRLSATIISAHCALVPSWHWRARRFISERPLLFLIFHRRNKPMSERILVICSIFVVYDLNQVCLRSVRRASPVLSYQSWVAVERVKT